MVISFECAACGADYEIEITTIIEHPRSIKCENCDAAPAAHRSHALATALEDLIAAMAAIRTRVAFELSLETANLPPPYGKLEEQESAGGLDGGLAFDNADEDEEDEEEDEMDGMTEVDVDEEDDEEGSRDLPFPAFDDDDDDDDFDDDDDDDDDDDFDDLDDFDELDDDDEEEEAPKA